MVHIEVVHINSGLLLSHKENEIMPFAVPWRDLRYHTKLSQSKTNTLYHLHVDSKTSIQVYIQVYCFVTLKQ